MWKEKWHAPIDPTQLVEHNKKTAKVNRIIVESVKDHFVDAFVASGGIPTSGLGVMDVGIVIGTRLHFHLSENTLGMKLGLHGLDDGICGFVLGLHTHKKVKFDVDLWRGFYVDP